MSRLLHSKLLGSLAGGAGGAGGGGLGDDNVSLIADTTLGGTAASVTFSAIPGTFKHLELICLGRTDIANVEDYIYVQFNGDTGSNYDNEAFGINSATTAGVASYAQTRAPFASMPGSTASADRPGSGNLLIPHYAGTTFHKHAQGRGGAIFGTSGGNATVRLFTINWRDTSAITQIVVLPESGNFIAGSRFSLYGWV